MDGFDGKPPNIKYDLWLNNKLEVVKLRTVWTIDNCSLRTKEFLKCWSSNPFEVIGFGLQNKLVFKLDPVGWSCPKALHANGYNCKSECQKRPSIKLDYLAHCPRLNAVKRIYINGTELRNSSGEIGWSSTMSPVYLSRTFLKDDVRHDTLTIVCDIRLTTDDDIKTTEEHVNQIKCREKEMNFEHLDKFEKTILGNKESSDVTIKCDDKEFYCHQSVLSARSPVLRAMFQTKMKEKETGSIDIEEFPSEVVKKMLFYVYSGIVPDIDKWGKELLNIADKYQLLELKMSLGKKLASIIDDENCIEYLALGDLFNVKEMKDTAINVIKRNVDHFVKKKNWKKELQNLSSPLVLEILEKVIEK